MNIFSAVFLLTTSFMVIEPSESDIIFDHRTHFVEREIGCESCHTAVIGSRSAADENIPTHENCADCHSMEKAPEDCVLCHADPDNPVGASIPPREIIFSHSTHLGRVAAEPKCLFCHTGMEKITAGATSANFPLMDDCFGCHDGAEASAECTLCHSRPLEMSLLVHDPGWKHEHKFAVETGGQNCAPCHQAETFCSECHAGDNLVENIHGLNFRFTHGLEASGKAYECQSCHETESFCDACHQAEAVKPLGHLQARWLFDHGEAAENDIEKCAACHIAESPTCARSGCHLDDDGVRGTNPSIHFETIDDLGHGPWHDDPGFHCFQCHTNTNMAGQGFCGYCHGEAP